MGDKDYNEKLNQRDKLNVDLKSLPLQQYLDQTLTPVLSLGLKQVSELRPSDPVTFLGDYLLKTRKSSGQGSK